MTGFARLFHAAAGSVLRSLAAAPLTVGEGLVAWAGWHERRSRAPGQVRESLAARRPAETFNFTFSREAHGFGVHYTATIGRYPDGRIAEVFLDCHHLASTATDEALAVAHLISLGLQHGLPVATLKRTCARFEDGRPCTLHGRIADLLAEIEGDPLAVAVPQPLAIPA